MTIQTKEGMLNVISGSPKRIDGKQYNGMVTHRVRRGVYVNCGVICSLLLLVFGCLCVYALLQRG